MASLSDRLQGRGFAVFSRNEEFIGKVFSHYLRIEQAPLQHVVIIHHPTTTPSLVESFAERAREASLFPLPVPWAEYGRPNIVAQISDLPGESLVFVSLDHQESVRDRLDVRRGYVRRKEAKKKIAVSPIPYEVQPWRVYFPFAFFDRDFMGYHHSYALEQDYEKFLNGLNENNPCEAGRIAALTKRAAITDGVPVFPELPPVRILTTSTEEQAEYAKVRDQLFDTEKTFPLLKSKLNHWIQVRHRDRCVPTQLHRVYHDFPAEIVITDLPFDRWLHQEFVSLVTHTNQLIGLWRDGLEDA